MRNILFLSMQTKTMATAGLLIVSPPAAFCYLLNKSFKERDYEGDRAALYFMGGIAGVGVTIMGWGIAELETDSLTKPTPEIVYSTSDITVSYDTEKHQQVEYSKAESVAAVVTSYGIAKSFFTHRTYTPVTELTITPSSDYSCQWRMDGHVSLDKILDGQVYNTVHVLEGVFHVPEPTILLKTGAKATDPHIVEYAQQVCRERLAKES